MRNRDVKDAAFPVCLLLSDGVWGSVLHAMRSLDSAGARVMVASPDRGSEIFAKSRVHPETVDIDLAEGPFLEQALAWARGRAADSRIVVIPTSDRTAAAMHASRHLFVAPFDPVLAPVSSLDQLLDKAASLSRAHDLGLSVPPWVEVRTPEQLGRLARLRLPLIVKPSSWATVGSAPFKVAVHETMSGATEFCRLALASGAELIVQEYLRAATDQVEFGIVWVSKDSSVLEVCTGRKRRQSSDTGGVMAWGETEDLCDVRAATIRFVRGTGFTGPGGIEFIRSQQGLHFIEFNPRLEAIHFLASAAGLDTVALSYHDVGRGVVVEHRPRQQAAAAWIGSAWLLRLQENPGTFGQMLRDRVAFGRSPRATRAVLTWSDPGPALQVMSLLARGTAARVRAPLRRRMRP